MQLVGNRELAGNEILEQPCLPASELVSSQNYVGLRGRTRTGRPYPTFHGIRKSSTCGFDFTDCGMLGGSRPGPVNRHGFEIAGWAGALLVPIMGLAPAGWPLADGGPRRGSEKRRSAGLEMSQGRRRGGRRQRRRPRGAPPRADKGIAGPRGPFPRLRPRPGCAPAPPPAKYFPKLSLHRRGSSRIVLLRTGA